MTSQALAVYTAFNRIGLHNGPSFETDRKALAAALRAAAGCVPKEEWGGENYATGFRDGIAFSCQFLHELAAELEGSNG